MMIRGFTGRETAMMSRRFVLVGVVLLCSTAGWSCRCYGQGFASIAAEAVWTADVRWYLRELLEIDDRALDDVEVVRTPLKPCSTANAFHHQFADPYKLKANEWSKKVAVFPNRLEIAQMRREMKDDAKRFHGKPLVLRGQRRALTMADARALRNVALLYDVEVRAKDVLYVVELADVRKNKYTGFAVKRDGKACFLIEE